ncbi:MAG: serine/threonine protein kinase [Anaerolineales bacterium]|nr:serine/threonine protein kinase [Anaerolineales bacterium]
MSSYAIIAGKMLQIGDQFDHFQIQAHMAQGGMSDIYRAFDLVNRREVVIKIPDQSMLGDPAQFERFQRELEVMKTLDHPAILKGLGSGKYNRVPYLVTEFVDGKSLRSLIESSAPLPTDQVVSLIRKIADGMAYCHTHDVVHRDIKPENILITASGQPVIMDFGLALTKGSHRVTYSNLSATMGTPDYMAPEQIEGQRGDQRTDLYALGTIMFELLSGKMPFTGDNNMVVMAQHLNNTAPRLDHVNPAITPQIAAIVATCLARNPDDRYSDMTAFIEALDHPENADLSILEKSSNASSGSSMSMAQMQVVRGVLIAVGIIVGLVLLALGLQYLNQ